MGGMESRLAATNTIRAAASGRINPARNMRPETLANALDAFERGRLSSAARIFEEILSRDDIICGLNLKRKKSVARLDYEIVLLENSEKAHAHKKALEKFYASLTCASAVDGNVRGGLRMLVSQMLDCVAMKYSVHKTEFLPVEDGVTAIFTQYPLWIFENTEGRLRLLEREGQLTPGRELDDGWMVSCGDGLMRSSAIAYLFKQLPLKDWLVYCERNGMPGIKAKTDAYPGTPQWQNACDAVREFGAEFHAVLSEGTDIEAIDVSTRGELPYPKLVERIDRLLCALWRGSDLSTISASNNIGASVQWNESALLEEDDAVNVSDTLNRNIDPKVVSLVFGDSTPLAKFRLKTPEYETRMNELNVIERLCALGLKPDAAEIARRFSFPLQQGKAENGGR